MTQKEAQKLPHGVYVLHWKSGGFSLAAIGSLTTGKRWFAPTNWTASAGCAISIVGFGKEWGLISEVELLKKDFENEQY